MLLGFKETLIAGFFLVITLTSCSPNDPVIHIEPTASIGNSTLALSTTRQATVTPKTIEIKPGPENSRSENQASIQFAPWEIVHDLQYSQDGLWLAVSAGDTVHIYESEQLAQVVEMSAGAWTNRLAFHSRLPLVAMAVRDGSIQFRDIITGNIICQFIAHHKGTNSLSISPDGRTMATTGTDITSNLWDISSLLDGRCDIREIGSFIGESFSSPDIEFSPDGKSVALIDLTNIRLRNSQDLKLISLLESDRPIYDIVFSPDGRWLAAAQHQGMVTLWDITTPQSPIGYTLPLSSQNSHGWRVAFSPDSHLLAGSSSDGWVVLYEVPSMAELSSFFFPRAVTALAFSPDGTFLGAGGLDADFSRFPIEP